MKYDIDNNDISVVALLIIGVVALFLLRVDSSTMIGAIIGFIGRGVGMARKANGDGDRKQNRVAGAEVVGE